MKKARMTVVLLIAAFAVSCAASGKVSLPPPQAAATAPADESRPEAAAIDAELRDLEQRIAATKDVAELPPLLLRHGRATLDSALVLRIDRLHGWSAGMLPDAKRAVAYGWLLLRAMDDFSAIITRHSRSPEAAEAQFMMGLVYDYPYQNDFGLALKGYSTTVRTYPDSPAARRAQDRIEAIDVVQRKLKGEVRKTIP